MSNLQQVDESNFQEIIDGSDVPVLVDFFADWCPPCRRLGPTLESLAEDMTGRLLIVKVNVDKSSLSTKFGVMNIPTMIVFKGGEEVKRLVGNQAKRVLEKELDPFLDA
jgi:thioredoxin 1